uniref:Uncharacterized protein n=1 Tax=Cacopsylla melanoneura TaxID=428564 RepID=A0A8D8SED7_9HEMI
MFWNILSLCIPSVKTWSNILYYLGYIKKRKFYYIIYPTKICLGKIKKQTDRITKVNNKGVSSVSDKYCTFNEQIGFRNQSRRGIRENLTVYQRIASWGIVQK